MKPWELEWLKDKLERALLLPRRRPRFRRGEEGLDLRVQTPFHFESTDDEAYEEVNQGDNVKDEELDEEETNKEEELNELYRDLNVNLERRDTEMTDALQTNVLGTQVIEDTHVIITAVTPEAQHQSSSVSSGFISNMLNPNPDTGIDFILNLNTESISLVDVPITKNVEMPPSFITTPHLPLIPHIQPLQQTPVPIPTIVPISKILPRIKKSVNEQLEAEVLISSSNEAKISHKNLYKALVDTYESNKYILATYGDTVTLKIHRDDEDEDEEPSAGSNRGSKRRRTRKEPESTSAPKKKTSKSIGKSKEGSKSHQAEEPTHNVEDLEEPAHQEFDTGSIVIRRHVEDLQLGIESYQKKLNITKPDTYRSDLKRKTPYTTYSNPKGFIYQTKDKKNRLMRIDELHKFSDGTLNDIRSAIDDTLKKIWMKYLPQTI
ncbi:hypothetical protein Tco_0296372 [Tanacetum coccineum]